jgi:hypothetical protein
MTSRMAVIVYERLRDLLLEAAPLATKPAPER